MPSLTPNQALTVAHDLRDEFGSHATLLTRRLIRQRKKPVPWEALGLEPRVKDIAPFQSDTSAQEGHRYANALSSADPEIAVFVAESEKVTRQKIGERLEAFYDAMVTVLLGDDYLRCLHLAGEGFGVGRLDLKPQFWNGIPDRGDLENEPFNKAVDDQRKAIGLPFEFVTLDPATFYYEEDKRKQIVVGAEWGQRKLSVIAEIYEKQGKNGRHPESFLGPTVPDDRTSRGAARGSNVVDFVVVRTEDIIYHAQMGATRKGDKILWEGENLFGPSTGYIAWRGLPSGYPELDERYLPLIMNSLNLASHKNLFHTIQANLAILGIRMWTEEPEKSLGGASVGRQIAAEAKGADKTKRAEHGNIVADMERGRIVRWRDMAEGAAVTLDRLELDEERYRFPEPLAPESSSGESGRDTIRRQEASSRLLRQGFESRKQAIEELVTVCRRTMFGHKDFFADGRMIYIQQLVEGLGEDGTLRKQEVIAISEEDNIPHEIEVTVATTTQAAQLALNEEGIRLFGHLSQDTRDQDYFRIKNIPLENRRRQKDIVRAATYPETVKRAILAVNDRLAARVPPDAPELITDEEPGGAQPPGPAISAQPTPSQPEDVRTTMGVT